MNQTLQVSEWVRHYESCHLKMNALNAILETDGEKMLREVLGKLGLVSPLDVVKACRNDRVTR